MQAGRRELFTTIRTEGAILPPELLQRVAAGDKDLGGLKPADYHLIEGEPLNEAIVRSWNRLVGAWAAFTEAREKLPEGDLGTTVTRERWLLILFDELGYGRLQPARASEIDAKSYAVSHAWGEHVPIHLVGCNVPPDRRSQGVAGAASMSPHGLVQELLNRSDERLWGFVSNGLILRVLRDNSSLTRQAYVEFDVASMMDGDVYADFVVLWLVCHQSRVEGDTPHECWLERWSQEAVKQGTRALDGLRAGVEAAISALGGGFLSHPANTDLRDALHSGELDKQEYYRELLRLVYRLLFLFVSEDRRLLLDPDATPESFERYDRFYSTQRLRRLGDRRRGSKHADLYQGLRLVMEKLGDDDGCPALGLPALGSYLWSADATPHLDNAELPNTALLDAVRALATLEERGVRRSVDYRNLGAEELGSVYESLLELHPDVNVDAGTFALTTAPGNERKTTGSYYTPTSLISCLLDSALDPVLDEAATKGVQAILDLKVCDPACGSGHFLVAAAHRIAKRLGTARTGDEEPSPAETRRALRDVVGRCLYGVDVNPMAVELCKVSLWMEALEPGRPLSFLDAHIKCGNSLLGTTAAFIDRGIPDEAFKPIEGDDKEIARSVRKQNETEREGQLTLEDVAGDLVAALDAAAAALEATDDSSVESLREKERCFAALTTSQAYERAKLTADAWCSAFVQRHASDSPRITTGIVRRLANGRDVSAETVEEIRGLQEQYNFFQWEVQFPQVFGRDTSGFDLILGNPPWDRPKPEPAKYFASTHAHIADASNAAVRARRLSALEADDPVAFAEWKRYERGVLGSVSFLVSSGLFELTATGKFNLGNTFLDLGLRLVSSNGRVGLLNISGIATDDSGKSFISYVMETGRLVSLFDFENREGLFDGVHRAYRFSAITLAGSAVGEPADFVFFAHGIRDLEDRDRHIRFTAEDIRLLNPISRTCPIFRNATQGELVKALYRQAELYGPEAEVLFRWDVEPTFLFVMSDHSHLFASREDLGFARDPRMDDICPTVDGLRYLPLYESKMLNQFDHRWSSITSEGAQRDFSDEERTDPSRVAVPRYWMAETDASVKLKPLQNNWLIAVREVTNATNERTAIAALIPKYPVGHNAQVFAFRESATSAASLLANFNSFCLDFAARTKVGGSHMSSFILRQLPVLPRPLFLQPAPWEQGEDVESWILPRVLELTYNAWDLARFAEDCGNVGSPFRWDPERRALLRGELDAAFFYLYDLAEADVDYVMESFPIVKRRDEEKYGHYRTKALILDVYRKMADAIATGAPYETILDPPAADPRVAHRPRGAAIDLGPTVKGART